MEFKVNLPLRLSLSFYNWQGAEPDFQKILKAVEHLKLFSLSLEFDRQAFSIFQKSFNEFSFKAFKKTLIIDFKDYADNQDIIPIFNEVEVDIPFFSQEREIELFLNTNPDKNFIISFLLTGQNIKVFEKILFYAQKYNKKIKIPNPNLIRYKNELSKIYLRKEDLLQIKDLKPLVKNINIEVHDYFLAKFFELSDADRFAGCQAGKLMGHIENGNLYPCASIPEKVGSLLEYSFEILWNRAYNIVDEVCKKCCIGCNKRDLCKLGCIGNAVYLGDCKDPLCEE